MSDEKLLQLFRDYIDEHTDEMISDLAALCAIPSVRSEALPGAPYGEEARRALDAACELMERYGLRTRVYDDKVVSGDINDLPRALDILAHVDVVPAGEGWKVTEPYTPLVKDGRIYARGTSDDKGPAIASLYAMRAVRDLGIPIKGGCRLVLGSDEESGMEDLPAYLCAEGEAPMTFSPDSHFPVTNVEKGQFKATLSRSFQGGESACPVSFASGDTINIVPAEACARVGGIAVNVTGRASHASLPENGINAGVIMIHLLRGLSVGGEAGEAIAALAGLFPYEDYEGLAIGAASSDPVTGATSVSPDIWRMDESGVSVRIDMRTSFAFDADKVREKAEEAGFSLEIECDIPPHAVEGDSFFVQTLLCAYKMVSGLEGYTEAIGGGTYVHGFQNGVAFGAVAQGTDTHMHGADEFIPVEELKDAAVIYALSIAKLLG